MWCAFDDPNWPKGLTLMSFAGHLTVDGAPDFHRVRGRKSRKRALYPTNALFHDGVNRIERHLPMTYIRPAWPVCALLLSAESILGEDLEYSRARDHRWAASPFGGLTFGTHSQRPGAFTADGIVQLVKTIMPELDVCHEPVVL
jgi:hypothetical protein